MKISTLLFALVGFAHAEEWKPLLDPALANWEVFIGIPHKSVDYPGLPNSGNDKCIQGTPVGLGNDALGIFTMIEQEGQPVLHISGQVYAGLSTKEEFENYHLSWQFKWGEKKWPPRLTDKRDSGVLFHGMGKQGAFWNVWLRSLECQIQEGDCGDFIPLAGTAADIRMRLVEGNSRPIFDADAPLHTNTNYTRHSKSPEKPNGEWNTMEIYTVAQTAVFVVNGVPNMVLFNTRQKTPKGETPLTRGKIQIQSEAAEIFYRDMKIRPISAFPESIAPLTVKPEGEFIRFDPPKPPARKAANREDSPPSPAN
jgi:hypothetical protein